MNKFLSSAALSLGLTLVPAYVATVQAETLSDAFISAYRNSNLLDKQRATLRAADEGVAQAFSTLRPSVDFAVSSGYSRRQLRNHGPFTEALTTNFELSASLVLLDFGRRALAIEMQKETVLSTREALRNVEQQVLYDAVSAYVDVQVATQLVGLRQSNVRLVTQELRAAEDRFEVGEITRTDVSIAEARLAAARAALSSAEGNLLIAREAYKAATGAYPNNLSAVPRSPSIPKTMEEARQIALRGHPLILQAQHGVKVADLNVDLQKAGYKPTVSMSASSGINDYGIESQSVGIALRQNLYSGGKQSSLMRQAIANRDGSRASLKQAGVELSEAVGNAWALLTIANAQVIAGDRQIASAQTAFEGVREEANLGARTTLDVLDAEQELLDARVARIQADAQRYLGVYQLLQAMGLLTVEHLKLGIPTYDPAVYYNSVKNAPAHSPQGAKLDRILKKLQ